MSETLFIQLYLVFLHKKELQLNVFNTGNVCPWQGQNVQSPSWPLLGKGRRIAPFYDSVTLPARAQENTSLTIPMAENGGSSREQAQVWDLKEPTMHYTEYACHSCPGSFPFKCELESIKANELRKSDYYLSVYSMRLFHHHLSVCHT